MHDRSNGLGGGFAAYGIYPEHKDEYAIHVFYDSSEARKQCEDFLFRHFNIDVAEELPAKFQALKKALIFGVISVRQTVCE